jgi:3-hydroxyacyl-CoA dehydrogenase
MSISSALLDSTHASVAVIHMCAPPVNSLGLELRQSILDRLRQAHETASVGAIVIVGSERAFSGGADVREFGTALLTQEPSLRTLTRIIEECTKPVIAAISGACMGGGFELALACHFRLARPDASIALPEVKLGIMPGAGGTQRFPRAVGLEIALDMILSGRTVRAGELRATGVFDEIVDGDLPARAIAFAERLLAERRPPKRLRDVRVDHPRAATVLAAAKTRTEQAAKGQPAPLVCMQAVASTLAIPFEEGLRLESQLCDELIATPESKALRHIFAAERAAGKVTGVPPGALARTIRQVGILGANPAGCAIATCCLDAGLRVVIVERNQRILERGMAAILGDYEQSVAKGAMETADIDRRLAALGTVSDSGAITDCDLIVDTSMDPLHGGTGALEDVAPQAKPGAVLSSSDSYADLNRIARATGRPQDMVGLHFFSPVRSTRVIEVVRCEKTAADVLATCLAFAKRLNKIPVLCGVAAGLIGDRMFGHYLAVAKSLVARGASSWQIDRALMEFGMDAAPFQTQERKYGSSARPADGEPLDGPRLDDREIVGRCVYALANEGARILEEGIALRSSDVDLISVQACGFPAYRGGPMHYANETGLEAVAAALRDFAADARPEEPFWTVSPRLARLAAANGAFS